MTVIPFLKPEAEIETVKTKLMCSACGAPGEGSCGCGVAYVTPGEIVRKAIADPANADKSNRLLADELGVDEGTVRNARKAVAENSATEKRKGKGGKRYKAKKPKAKKPKVSEPTSFEDTIMKNFATDCNYDPGKPDDSEQVIRRRGFMWRAQEAVRFASNNGAEGHGMITKANPSEIDKEIIQVTRQAAEAWQVLLAALIKRSKE